MRSIEFTPRLTPTATTSAASALVVKGSESSKDVIQKLDRLVRLTVTQQSGTCTVVRDTLDPSYSAIAQIPAVYPVPAPALNQWWKDDVLLAAAYAIAADDVRGLGDGMRALHAVMPPSTSILLYQERQLSIRLDGNVLEVNLDKRWCYSRILILTEDAVRRILHARAYMNKTAVGNILISAILEAQKIQDTVGRYFTGWNGRVYFDWFNGTKFALFHPAERTFGRESVCLDLGYIIVSDDATMTNEKGTDNV